MTSKQAEQARFLVDVNLPKKFRYFNSALFAHIVDIDPSLKDKEIWDYALANNLTILTKDTDFYEMFLTHERCPKVVAFKVGNLTLQQLHHYFSENWPTIVSLLAESSFIMAYLDKIKIIK